jgi:hypothetical protein
MTAKHLLPVVPRLGEVQPILPMLENQQFGSRLSSFRHVISGSFTFNSITLT